MFAKSGMTDYEIFSAAGALPVQDVLALRAWLTPEKTLFTFLGDDGEETGGLTYRELWSRCEAVAASLALSSRPGDRIMLFYPPGLDFVSAFVGCLMAGRIAVPVNLPSRRRAERSVRIIQDCGARLALGLSAQIDEFRASFEGSEAADMVWIATDALEPGAGAPPTSRSAVDMNAVAYLQYTSGSTSNPKGVMITFGNLTTNCRMIRDTLRLNDESTMVFWQPHHHDMGLICAILLPIVIGNHTVLMAPNTFVRQPMLWIELIAKHRAEVAGGPNFAFDITSERYSAERMAGLDLSRWRLALNGSDIVRPTTLDRFSDRFGPHGFRPETFLVCYGMAEAVLFLSAGPVGQKPRYAAVDVDALEQHGQARPPSAPEKERLLVGCGEPSWEVEVAIVDPETRRRLPDGEVGEIWINSPTIGIGYWGNPEESRRVFQARIAGDSTKIYLRTGDLGFVNPDDFQVYVCGRIKDLIISEGRNLHPEDIEYSVVGALAALGESSTLSCAAFNAQQGDEQLIVAVVEVDRSLKRNLADRRPEIERAVRRAVSADHGVSLHRLLFIPPSAMCKTTSGKVQRGLMRQLYVGGAIKGLEPAEAAA
ncbi:acyl-CoA synthetase [Methylopila jiangsuensis]|uniref:Acyl-CoA synthetase n=2 Tax=Methylopila jiangsuensis TaxID=586230 RepID=A0A9W6JI57_9HYPH|nr:fatty acyl-AMP ligase [Methylopila jiangsuensis]GLK76851.1 acyl-CoA synthetase [Methylopila jiangsuensis]